MANSWELLKKRLQTHFEPYGAVAEFCKKTGLARSGVDRWMKPKEEGGGSPSIESLDLIAEALGISPWDAIKPEADSKTPSKLAEAISLISGLYSLPNKYPFESVLFSLSSIAQISGAAHGTKTADEGLQSQVSDPQLEEITSLFSSFNDDQKRRALLSLQSIKRTALASSHVPVARKKAK